MNQYISLSFSFMTFVIQSKIEEIDDNTGEMQDAPLLDKAFDIEAFTYMLNRNSCFTSGNLMYGNFIKLQRILINMLKYDPVYLEVLHYTIESEEL